MAREKLIARLMGYKVSFTLVVFVVRFKHPTKADFIGVVNEVAGKDMTWFFNELFDSTRAFDYGVAGFSSVKVPPHLRGVYDTNGARQEWTEKTIKASETANTTTAPGEGTATPENLVDAQGG